MATARVRLGALTLAVAGVLFVLYPAIRPYSDETSLQGAAAFASNAWIVVHVLAIAGLLVGIGATLAVAAVWRSDALPRWSGSLFGLAFGLFIPQFFASPPIRVAHGLLVTAGCAWLAVTLWQAQGWRTVPGSEGRDALPRSPV